MSRYVDKICCDLFCKDDDITPALILKIFQVNCNYSVMVLCSTSMGDAGNYSLDFVDPADLQTAAR
jgi:hypothetical protein